MEMTVITTAKTMAKHRSPLAALAVALLALALPSLAWASSNPPLTVLTSSSQYINSQQLDNLGINYDVVKASAPQTNSYLLSAIGDSLITFPDLQSSLDGHLNDPSFQFRSIPGTTQINFNGLPGATSDQILNMVNDQNLGAGEGANFVVIMCGTNDIDYTGLTPQQLAPQVASNIQGIIDSALGGNTDRNARPAIVVMGVPGYRTPPRNPRPCI